MTSVAADFPLASLRVFLKVLRENNGIVMHRVSSAIKKGHSTGIEKIPHLVNGIVISDEFSMIAPFELIPFLRIVAEPLA